MEEINGAIGKFELKSNGKPLVEGAEISYFLFGQVAVNEVVVFWISTDNGLESEVLFPTYNSGYQRIHKKLSIKEFFGSLIFEEMIHVADEECNLRTRFQFDEILKK